MAAFPSLLRQASCIKSTARLLPRNALPITSRLRAQCQLRTLSQHTRFASTATPNASQKRPRLTNIYRAGTAATLTVGITRGTTIVVFLAASIIYAPNYILSPDHSSWLAPAFIVASAVPALVTILATGPMVHAVRVHIPEHVKRSGKEALRRFSADTPGNTKVELSFMRFAPWPQTRAVAFGNLRRLRPSFKGGISNMELIPQLDEKAEAMRKKYPLFDAFLQRWLTRFYVSRDQKKDRAAVPGVWDGMWQQIPFAGEDDGRVRVKRSAPIPPHKLRPVVPPRAAVGRP
ncbi:hypothetical protein BST61_g9410 [Cercospora zeina]